MKMKRMLVCCLFLSLSCMHSYASDSIQIKGDLLYDKYTLNDTYKYGKEEREIQWSKIKQGLRNIDNFEHEYLTFGILQNVKNRNGKPPVTKDFIKTKWNYITDSLGVRQSQAIPLYDLNDLSQPAIYGRDGALIAILSDSLDYYKIAIASKEGEWYVPKKYLFDLGPVHFDKVIFVDRKNQNIVTLEYSDGEWLVRSKNPATTGLNHPPYKEATPLGVYVLQQKLAKMVYLKDGSDEVGGYAPYANRFSDGAYIHGVPVNVPNTEMVEYSSTLGTTPRSHMCVRNATSHAKFIYDWAPVNETLVYVIE